MKKVSATLCGFLICSSIALAGSDKAKLDERIEAAHAVLIEFMSTPDEGIPEEIAAKATCIAVVPGIKKGAFLVGAQYGQGVATCQTAGGRWSAPVFIQLTGGSFGFQVGGQSTDLVLVGVSHKSIDLLMEEKVKLGGDIAVAAGPVGRNSRASTTELANAELLTYSRNRGIFAGIDLTGDVVHENDEDTETYYGNGVSYQKVLSGGVPPPASARHFVATVNQMFKSGRHTGGGVTLKGDGGSPPKVNPPGDDTHADIALYPKFPWPPPDPSASVEIPQRFIKDAGTAGSVVSRLNDALSHCGYVERSYYTTPSGIAIVTRLERINRSGVPFPDPDRWFRRDARNIQFGLKDFLLSLVGADEGYYRVVVFLLTNKAYSSTKQPVTTDDVVGWLDHGLKTLPSALASIPLSEDDRFTALIYEFEQPHSGDPHIVSPSDIGAKDHLEGSGLLSMLLFDNALRELK